MAADMFLELDGIDGEVPGPNFHKNKIDIYSFSWGLSNSASGHTGGGSGAGIANVSDLQCQKYVDESSTNKLIMFCYQRQACREREAPRPQGGRRY